VWLLSCHTNILFRPHALGQIGIELMSLKSLRWCVEALEQRIGGKLMTIIISGGKIMVVAVLRPLDALLLVR
jgi:hypothetical protein